MGNPTLQAEFHSQLQALQVPSSTQEERVPIRPPCETSKRGISLGHGEEIKEEPLCPIVDAKGLHNSSYQELSKERNESDTSITYDSDTTPRRQHAKRSPPTASQEEKSTPSLSNLKKGGSHS